ncbi:MAG: hypothetical protein HYS21_08520 [Deltaproteobacteria bacterium]|nr:hypothetical protein [Deltaproteobacteria bacterium]
MECPYLEGGNKASYCNASFTLMVPSMDEKTTYCDTEEHYRCPMLLSHVLRGGDTGVASNIN